MFLKNKNISFKIRRSKVTNYAALSIPSPKDVDCILASYIAYRRSNKTQFCSMFRHVHHKSNHSEGSDEFAHFAQIRKDLSDGVRL